MLRAIDYFFNYKVDFIPWGMKLSIYFIVIMGVLSCTFCTINGNFRGLYSYYSKTNSENPRLFKKLENAAQICELKNNGTPEIYIINATNLRECLLKTEYSVVYIWAPRCKSRYCYPIDLLQQNCNAKGVDLFIVAEYYDKVFMEVNYKINRPIFGIDTYFYQSDLTLKYLSKFISELNGGKKVNGRFLSFNNGNFNNSFNDLDDFE